MHHDDLPVDPDVLDEDRATSPTSPRDRAVGNLASVSWRHWWRHRRAMLGLIALGGGLGSVARYGVARLLPTDAGGFPWATFLVNICGCLLVGALMVLFVEVRPGSRYGRAFLVIGVIGGLTTYSTLMTELRALAAARDWSVLIAYLASSVAVGAVAVAAGIVAARAWAHLPLLGPPDADEADVAGSEPAS